VRVTVGEFHYVARDPETSFPGIRMYEVDRQGNKHPLNMFWNDELVQEWAVLMPNEPPYTDHQYKAAQSSGASGVYSGDYGDNPIPHGEPPDDNGNARSWGNFLDSGNDSRGQGNSKGNWAYLDTYTWIADDMSDDVTVNVVDGNNDTDNDGLTDFVEMCITGTKHNKADSDDDTVNDYIETNGGQPGIDTDGDGVVNGMDENDDGDCVLTKVEDPDGDGDPTNDNTDGDSDLNYLDNDDDADSILSCDEDADGDGDPTNDDTDGDGIVNYLDPNDNDGPDGDLDNDGIRNADDNCVLTPNTDQADMDGDGQGDVCDDDVDGDGISNIDDNCYIDNRKEIDPDDPVTAIDAANPDQTDVNGDGIGDACQPDADSDGIPDVNDNCVYDPNPGQENMDAEGSKKSDDDEGDDEDKPIADDKGDACDDDIDGDGLTNKEEKKIGTNPRDFDTDDGGVNDGQEVENGTNPVDDPIDDPGPRQVSGGGLFECTASAGNADGGWTLVWMLGILIAIRQRSMRRRGN
jgi:hypothetical protein